jgi:hypothetical protein
MKKYLSILFAAATAVALIASCEKNGDNGGTTIDADDPATVKTENLVAYFPLESETNAVEAVGIKYSKKAGAAGFVKGMRGNAYSNTAADCTNISYLEFDVASDNPFKTMSSFTISCWMKMPIPNSGSPAMLSLNGGDPGMGNILVMFEGWGCNSDSLFVKPYLYNSVSREWKGHDLGKSASAYKTDKWFHLVYSYNENDSKMYVYADGTLVVDNGRWKDPQDAEGNQDPLGKIVLGEGISNFYVGAWFNNLNGDHADVWRTSYSGLVDEIRIWNIALTPEEIEDLYTKEVVKADGIQ